MRKCLSLLLLTLLPVFVTAQETIYFDKDWKPTSKKKNAAFYRPLPQKEGDVYKLVDYYINGKVQMTGYYSVANPQILMREPPVRSAMHGTFKYYYPDGTLKSHEEYVDGELHGEWSTYDEKGQKQGKGQWTNGKRAGDWILYYEGTNHVWYTSSYILDKLNGVAKSYYPDGKLKRDAIYTNNDLTAGKMFDQQGNEIPYTPFEQMPTPAYDLPAYLSSHIVYPMKARTRNIEGRVRVQFYVNETGEISNAFVSAPVHTLLDKEALRVVKSMPKWNPGKMDDKPVKVHYTLPVRFQLE